MRIPAAWLPGGGPQTVSRAGPTFATVARCQTAKIAPRSGSDVPGRRALMDGRASRQRGQRHHRARHPGPAAQPPQRALSTPRCSDVPVRERQHEPLPTGQHRPRAEHHARQPGNQRPTPTRQLPEKRKISPHDRLPLIRLPSGPQPTNTSHPARNRPTRRAQPDHRKNSEMVWWRAGYVAFTRATANRITGLPPKAAPCRDSRNIRRMKITASAQLNPRKSGRPDTKGPT